MKKIIIVNNNMKVGGVQRSLCNLLWELAKDADLDVSLVLFRPVGDYMDRIPKNVKVIAPRSLFRYLGVSQGEMKGIDRLKRGFLAGVCRAFGRAFAMKIILCSQKRLPDHYDYAIAFLHNGKKKAFYGGVQEFVLHRIHAKKKIAFLHGDYDQCGANHKLNNKIMEKFDTIAACSDGCRAVFEAGQPHLAYQCVTVRNCNHIEEIQSMAAEDTVVYDSSYINVLCAARFSPLKGIDRAIEAASFVLKKGIPIKLHILGSGVMESELKRMVEEKNLAEHVTFYGEQSNPYRFMKNADLFLLTSFHEAAPMVIDEAYILGVPTLTTRTNSSDEMVSDRGCGWVCENNQDDLNKMLFDVLSDLRVLYNVKEALRTRVVDNSLAMTQFYRVIS